MAGWGTGHISVAAGSEVKSGKASQKGNILSKSQGPGDEQPGTHPAPGRHSRICKPAGRCGSGRPAEVSSRRVTVPQPDSGQTSAPISHDFPPYTLCTLHGAPAHGLPSGACNCQLIMGGTKKQGAALALLTAQSGGSSGDCQWASGLVPMSSGSLSVCTRAVAAGAMSRHERWGPALLMRMQGTQPMAPPAPLAGRAGVPPAWALTGVALDFVCLVPPRHVVVPLGGVPPEERPVFPSLAVAHPASTPCGWHAGGALALTLGWPAALGLQWICSLCSSAILPTGTCTCTAVTVGRLGGAHQGNMTANAIFPGGFGSKSEMGGSIALLAFHPGLPAFSSGHLQSLQPFVHIPRFILGEGGGARGEHSKHTLRAARTVWEHCMGAYTCPFSCSSQGGVHVCLPCGSRPTHQSYMLPVPGCMKAPGLLWKHAFGFPLWLQSSGSGKGSCFQFTGGPNCSRKAASALPCSLAAALFRLISITAVGRKLVLRQPLRSATHLLQSVGAA